jgi:hypothetical protein
MDRDVEKLRKALEKKAVIFSTIQAKNGGGVNASFPRGVGQFRVARHPTRIRRAVVLSVIAWFQQSTKFCRYFERSRV